MTRSVHVIGGGTISHVRNHLALCAPAYGGTARSLSRLIQDLDPEYGGGREHYLHLTRMADPRPTANARLETNDDVAALVDRLVADKGTRVIVMNAALCDFTGQVIESGTNYKTPSGKYETRLKTSEGIQELSLTPAEKIIQRIRKERKDIFLVAFKTTCNATPEEQYSAALHMLKASSANLVLANDTGTRCNMIVTPEEFHYDHGTDRSGALVDLARMTCARSRNTFTRSTVVREEGVPWHAAVIPRNLREVVNHCIERGAYKPFRGATVGHFAANVARDRTVVTSRRKDDFNKLAEHGMVLLDYGSGDHVEASGGKPSVGGMSQRIIFHDHPDKDCIVHFHSPLRPDAPDAERIGRASQKLNECGSHQCGQNTSDSLVEIAPGIAATHLEGHGPNIVFSKDVPAERVMEFIDANWALEEKTGGLVA